MSARLVLTTAGNREGLTQTRTRVPGDRLKAASERRRGPRTRTAAANAVASAGLPPGSALTGEGPAGGSARRLLPGLGPRSHPGGPRSAAAAARAPPPPAAPPGPRPAHLQAQGGPAGAQELADVAQALALAPRLRIHLQHRAQALSGGARAADATRGSPGRGPRARGRGRAAPAARSDPGRP